MKLYATVTSERASKGQGGEYLDIGIMNEYKEVVATISVRAIDGTKGYDTRRTIKIWHNAFTDVYNYKSGDRTETTKGEKKKDETRKCADGKHYHAENVDYPNCYMSM